MSNKGAGNCCNSSHCVWGKAPLPLGLCHWKVGNDERDTRLGVGVIQVDLECDLILLQGRAALHKHHALVGKPQVTAQQPGTQQRNAPSVNAELWCVCVSQTTVPQRGLGIFQLLRACVEAQAEVIRVHLKLSARSTKNEQQYNATVSPAIQGTDYTLQCEL